MRVSGGFDHWRLIARQRTDTTRLRVCSPAGCHGWAAPTCPAPFERERESAARYAAAALAPSTRRAYDRDWRTFAQWCVVRGLRPAPRPAGGDPRLQDIDVRVAHRDVRPTRVHSGVMTAGLDWRGAQITEMGFPSDLLQ